MAGLCEAALRPAREFLLVEVQVGGEGLRQLIFSQLMPDKFIDRFVQISRERVVISVERRFSGDGTGIKRGDVRGRSGRQ